MRSRGNKADLSRGCHACMIPERMLHCGQEYCCKACSPLETLPQLMRFYYSCSWSTRMKDTQSKAREGFEWLWVWTFKEGGRRYEIQNPVSVFWDFPFILVCKNTSGVCERGDTGLLPIQDARSRLTCKHEIPEIRELVDDHHRHFET